MDVNGTRFQLLLGRQDWTARLGPDPEHPEARPAHWDQALQELTLWPQLFRFPSGGSGDRAVTPSDRRGADMDRFGNTYWIDTDARAILVQSSGTRQTSRFWPAAGADPSAAIPGDEFSACAAASPSGGASVPHLAALAVTTTHYLVVGTLAPAGLLVFDLQSAGPPRQLLWPARVPFAPFDAAGTPDGGVVIIDRASARMWTLDSSLRVVSGRPAPTGPDPAAGEFAALPGEPCPDAPPSVPPGTQWGISLDDALPLGGDPVAVLALPDGAVLVLDRRDGSAPSLLHLYRDRVEVGAPAAVAGIIGGAEASPPTDPTLQVDVAGHDMALATVDGHTALLVADTGGDQAYAFALSQLDPQLELTLLLRYYPMRLFGGKGLVFDRQRAYYDFGERWVPLVDQCRPRFETEAWLISHDWVDRHGAVQTGGFDGHAPGCIWHRLLVDARIPDGCAVEVWSRAADELWMLPQTPWSAEPVPRRRRAPDRPYLRQPDPYATWELLFQRARGRYLELKLHLTGDGRSSPHLHSLRASYPRFSYLEHYLPKLYREDEVSASFLDRFLANPEGIATEIEDRVAGAQVLLDSRAAPAEALDWLASFFDIALDPVWSETRRRTFIAGAMEFFRWRGTPHGLKMALRLALDDAALADEDVFAPAEDAATAAYRVVETFRLRTLPAVVAGDPTGSAAPRAIDPSTRWKPLDGRGALFARYGAFVGSSGPLAWPLSAPEDPAAASAWHAFTAAAVGFEPAASDSDISAWHEFLLRRYRTIETLDAAHGLPYAGFDEVPLFTSLPPDGAPLRDWYDFETVMLAMGRTAHRFSVLLPVKLGESPADSATDAERQALASRIVELQKPAHTVFDVRFYWDAFRLGSARLGEGTTVGLGSRSPQLLRPVVIGQSHTGEGYLGGDPPPRLTRPPSLGRRPVSDPEQETT